MNDNTQAGELAEHKAPHEALQDALFLYAHGYDGASATLIRGWPALVERVIADMAGDDWEGVLCDLDDWSMDGQYPAVPYHYSVNFEDGYMAIYRVHEDRLAALSQAAPAAQTPNTDRVLAESGPVAWAKWSQGELALVPFNKFIAEDALALGWRPLGYIEAAPTAEKAERPAVEERKPLTDEQLFRLIEKSGAPYRKPVQQTNRFTGEEETVYVETEEFSAFRFARLIECAHEIGGEHV